MVRFAVVKASELGDRWDAGYHIDVKEHAPIAEKLKAEMSEKAALDLVSDADIFPLVVLRRLETLVRGNHYRTSAPSRDTLLNAAKEYPHLALAILLANGSDALMNRQLDLAAEQVRIETARARIGEMQERLERLRQSAGLEDVGAGEPTSTDRSLSLPRGMRGLDEDARKATENNCFVAGVVYHADDVFHIPVATSETAYVADCWVVPIADWSPDLLTRLVDEGEVPVPVRSEDLGIPVGSVETLPDETVNHGFGWGGRPGRPRG